MFDFKIHKSAKYLPVAAAFFGTCLLDHRALAQTEVTYTSNLTLQTGNTPRLKIVDSRQTNWYTLSGNEVGFFVTYQSPSTTVTRFRIDKGAPSNTLVNSSEGNAGVGTAAPIGQLHVVKTAANGPETIALFHVSDVNAGWLNLGNASSTSNVFVPRLQGFSTTTGLVVEGTIGTDTGTNPAFVFNASRAGTFAVGTRPIIAFQNNSVAKVLITGNGNMHATSYNQVSSRTLKSNITELAADKAAAGLQQLTPVRFVYNADQIGQQHLGFIAEDVPEIVAEADRKSVPIPDVVALITRVVKDHLQTIDGQRSAIVKQQQQIDDEAERLQQQARILQDQEQSIEAYRKADRQQAKLIDELTKRLARLEQKMDDSD